MNKTLGQLIRELREKHDLSIRELGKKVDLSPAFLSDVELGRRHPSPDNLAKIAQALKTPLKTLLEVDIRPDTESVRRMASTDPAYGFAFRQIVRENISAQELIELLERRKKK